MMSRLSKALHATYRIIKNPWLLNRVFEDDEYWRKSISETYRMPGSLPVISIHQFLSDEECILKPLSFLDGGSLPADLALLTGLTKSIPSCRYFEIGTWRGESVANVARYAAESYTLNLSAEEMRKKGLKEEYVRQHGFFSRKNEKIIHLEGNSFTFDFASLGKKFDLIFIDGDHHYEAVKNDTLKVYEHLSHEDTIIVWNDYARDPEHVRFEVLAGILDGLPNELHHYLYHVSNTISAVLIKKDFPPRELQQPAIPELEFELILKTRRL